MKLTAQSGRRDKVHILLDGEYKITTNADFWNKCSYADGDEIDEAEFEALCGKINCAKALKKCGDFIGRREYSAKQVKDKLLQNGFDEEIAENAVQKCLDSALIDDRRFARAYVFHLYSTKSLPLARIRYELSAAGVDKSIAEEELEAAEIDDVQSIIKIVKRKYLSRVDFDNKKEVEKLTLSLARRGFSFADIKNALDEMESETQDEE